MRLLHDIWFREVLRTPVWAWLVSFLIFGFLVVLAVFYVTPECHPVPEFADCP